MLQTDKHVHLVLTAFVNRDFAFAVLFADLLRSTLNSQFVVLAKSFHSIDSRRHLAQFRGDSFTSSTIVEHCNSFTCCNTNSPGSTAFGFRALRPQLAINCFILVLCHSFQTPWKEIIFWKPSKSRTQFNGSLAFNKGSSFSYYENKDPV